MPASASSIAAGALSRPSYWLTRFLLLRLLGLVYLVAFLVAAEQALPLIGEHGLLPIGDFLRLAETEYGSRLAAFGQFPSLFWIDASDRCLVAAAWPRFISPSTDSSRSNFR